jgi:hypothetical protein
MRKIILVATMLLVSASAQAAGSRSLTLASADELPAATTTTDTPQATEWAKPADAPKYVDRPSAVSTAPVAETTKPKATAKADKPRRTRYWTEGRIISELHRHGIYW